MRHPEAKGSKTLQSIDNFLPAKQLSDPHHKNPSVVKQINEPFYFSYGRIAGQRTPTTYQFLLAFQKKWFHTAMPRNMRGFRPPEPIMLW